MTSNSNIFYYGLEQFLYGQTPISVANGMHYLEKAIADPRVLVYNDGGATNIGALRLVHKTGEVYRVSDSRPVFSVPMAKMPIILEKVEHRISTDNKVKSTVSLKAKIMNLFQKIK